MGEKLKRFDINQEGYEKKPFSWQLYKENNDRGIRAVASYLKTKGWWLNIKEDFGPDIKAFRLEGGWAHETLHEAEVRKGWKEGEWPSNWGHLRISNRKMRLIDMCKDKFGEDGFELYFWVVSNDLQMAMAVPWYTVEHAPKERLDNRYMKNELQAIIPAGKCTPIKLKGDHR
jgi:hypothetical protein